MPSDIAVSGEHTVVRSRNVTHRGPDTDTNFFSNVLSKKNVSLKVMHTTPAF